MKILVCGSRDFADRRFMYMILTSFVEAYGVDTLIHGSAAGADQMAQEIIQEFNSSWSDIKIESYSADWRQYGKAAGPLRNKLMLKQLIQPDIVLAFTNKPTGQLTTGTSHMATIARNAGFQVYIFGSTKGV